MRLTKYIVVLAGILLIVGYTLKQENRSGVLVCYGKLNPDKIRGYQYVILESDLYSTFDVKLIKKQNELSIAYLSVGEVSPHRSYYSAIKGKTLGKNQIWESYYLDLNDLETREVLFQQVDKIIAKGFEGLFLDTVDAFGTWGPLKDQAGAYISFIAELKNRFPSLHIMQNSGYTLLDKSNEYINSIAIESIYTDYDFKKSHYRMRDEKSQKERVDILRDVNSKYDIPVIVIEYVRTEKMRKKLQDKITNSKWHFFVGQIDLAELPTFK